MNGAGGPVPRPHPGVYFDLSSDDPKARVQAYLDSYKPVQDDPPETFDLALMRTHLRLVDAYRLPNGMAVATFSMIVARDLCSRAGMIHGGAASMIVDMCTNMAQAPIAKPGFWEFGGVSRTLSVTYLRPVPMNMEILIVCEVMQVGKAFATIQAKVYRKADMVLLLTGEHNKAYVDLKARDSTL